MTRNRIREMDETRHDPWVVLRELVEAICSGGQWYQIEPGEKRAVQRCKTAWLYDQAYQSARVSGSPLRPPSSLTKTDW